MKKKDKGTQSGGRGAAATDAMQFHEPPARDPYLGQRVYAVTVKDQGVRHQLLALGFQQRHHPKRLVMARSAFDTIATLRLRVFSIIAKVTGRCPLGLLDTWRIRREQEAAV